MGWRGCEDKPEVRSQKSGVRRQKKKNIGQGSGVRDQGSANNRSQESGARNWNEKRIFPRLLGWDILCLYRILAPEC